MNKLNRNDLEMVDTRTLDGKALPASFDPYEGYFIHSLDHRAGRLPTKVTLVVHPKGAGYSYRGGHVMLM